jgi:hypothetical protein
LAHREPAAVTRKGVSPEVSAAVDVVEAAGYTVVLTASYRRAQERQRLALLRAEWEKAAAEDARRWARDCLAEERRLRERCTYLYGLASKLGATPEQLRGEDAA